MPFGAHGLCMGQGAGCEGRAKGILGCNTMAFAMRCTCSCNIGGVLKWVWMDVHKVHEVQESVWGSMGVCGGPSGCVGVQEGVWGSMDVHTVHWEGPWGRGFVGVHEVHGGTSKHPEDHHEDPTDQQIKRIRPNDQEDRTRIWRITDHGARGS